MSEFEIPTIDISPYRRPGATAANDPACAEVSRAIDDACRTVGFMQIIGHGIDDEVIDGLAAALDEFFALPLEAKTDYRRPGENRGYAPPKSESLSMSLGVANANMMNDFYESFTIGAEASMYPDVEVPEVSYPANTWPAAAPAFETEVTAYWEQARDLSRVLLRACSDALSLGADYFDSLTDHSIDAMKMNNYALPPGAIELDGELTGMGAHTDFGILTVLWADQVAGLEVLSPDGVWEPVLPGDGALLINLGDAFARWTNDQWRSTLHRVNPPVIDGQIERRRSAAFFFDGNFDAVIEPLPGTVAEGAEPYPPITVGDHINAKIAGMKTGAAPTTADREAARVLNAQ